MVERGSEISVASSLGNKMESKLRRERAPTMDICGLV